MATREETKKMIEVMQAFVDGQAIEVCTHESCWFNTNDPLWDWHNFCYRIKVHEPKFKVGDYVRILDGSKIEDYRCGWTEDMDNYVGYIFEIENIHECNGVFCYTSDAHLNYNYDERGLELVEINNQ